MFPPVFCLRQEWHVVCQRVRRVHPVPVVVNCSFRCFFGLFVFFSVPCAYGGVLVLLVSLLCTGLGFIGVPPAGHALWAEVGGSITFVTSGENCLTVHKTACMYLGIHGRFMKLEPFMLPLAGQPSLHGYDACMVYWTKGALRRICRQKQCETIFFSFLVFSV